MKNKTKTRILSQLPHKNEEELKNEFINAFVQAFDDSEDGYICLDREDDRLCTTGAYVFDTHSTQEYLAPSEFKYLSDDYEGYLEDCKDQEVTPLDEIEYYDLRTQAIRKSAEFYWEEKSEEIYNEIEFNLVIFQEERAERAYWENIEREKYEAEEKRLNDAYEEDLRKGQP